MKLIDNINETKAPDAIVEPNATETTIPVVLCINKETGHEYLSSGDLVIIESTNSNKLERYVTLGKLTNVTTVSPNEEDDRHTFNQARVMVDIEDMEMGTYDTMLDGTIYKTGQVSILQVTKYQIGQPNPISSEGSISDPIPPNTPVYKLNDLSDIDLGTWRVENFGFFAGTDVPVPCYLVDNRTWQHDSRNKGFFGGTGSGKSIIMAAEVDRHFDTDMNMFVIDPKGQIAYQQLPTSRNFRRRAEKFNRKLNILTLNDIFIKLDQNVFAKLLNSKKLFGNRTYWDKMASSDRQSLVEVFTEVCFEELKTEFNNWIRFSYETSELVTGALEIIKNQYIQRIYSGTVPQNRLIGTIDRAITSDNILRKISNILEQVRLFFDYSENKLSVSDIAKDLLVGERTVTVVVPTIENNNHSDSFESDDVYQIFVSKILQEVRNKLRYPTSEFKVQNGYNSAIIVDEAQNLFPYNTQDEELTKATSAICEIAETYRSKGISTWVASPSPTLINKNLKNRIFDHDLYIGSKLTLSAKREINDQITDKNVQSEFDRIPKPHKELNKEGKAEVKHVHFLFKGKLTPLDHDEKGTIVRIDLEKDTKSDDI